MRRIKRLFAAIILMAATGALPPLVAGQTHFSECAENTGINATLLVLSAILSPTDGLPLATGDEIAVFTGDGVCAGLGVWEGGDLAVTAWGDDSMTATIREGFTEGEQIEIRFWDASTSSEYRGPTTAISATYAADQPHLHTADTFSENAIYELSSFTSGSPSSDPPLEANRSAPSAAQLIQTPLSFESPELPDQSILQTNYPNPFNPRTTVRFGLSAEEDVRLEVFDLTGRRVATLVDGVLQAGWHEAVFDGMGLASGVYLCRLQTPTTIWTTRMIMSK